MRSHDKHEEEESDVVSDKDTVLIVEDMIEMEVSQVLFQS